MSSQRTPVVFLLFLTTVCVMLQLFNVELKALLRYDRAAVGAGEVWRLLTGQFLHLGWSHIGLDFGTLWLIWGILHKQLRQPGLLYVLTMSLLGVGLGLYYGSPEVHLYVGISGALQGLLAAGALVAWRQNRVLSAVLLGYLMFKLLIEQYFGSLSFSEAIYQGTIAVDAHLYGALAGVVSYVFYRVAKKYTPWPQSEEYPTPRV